MWINKLFIVLEIFSKVLNADYGMVKENFLFLMTVSLEKNWNASTQSALSTRQCQSMATQTRLYWRKLGRSTRLTFERSRSHGG